MFHCEKSLGPLFYGPPSYESVTACILHILNLRDILSTDIMKSFKKLIGYIKENPSPLYTQ
jgi:hypothetical protein